MKGSIYIDKDTKGQISIYVDLGLKDFPGAVSKLYKGNNKDEAIMALCKYKDNKLSKLDKAKQRVHKNVNITINRIKRMED